MGLWQSQRRLRWIRIRFGLDLWWKLVVFWGSLATNIDSWRTLLLLPLTWQILPKWRYHLNGLKNVKKDSNSSRNFWTPHLFYLYQLKVRILLFLMMLHIVVGYSRCNHVSRNWIVTNWYQTPRFTCLTCTKITSSKVMQISTKTSLTYLRETTGCV